MSMLISHMKEPKACVACGAMFKPITRWQEFCTAEHRYAYTESVKQLGYFYLDTIKGKGEFMEFLKTKLAELDEKAGKKADLKEEQKTALDLKVEEIKATTWGEWIKTNFSSHEEQAAFIKENQGTTFMSTVQYLGETYEDFLKRGAEVASES